MQTNPCAEAQRWSLDDKFLQQEGAVYLTGIQALVRLTLDQHRADRRRGLKTATLVSGYRGSPLGGLDIAFERAAAIARAHEVRFVNGVNEELAATAVFGSQLASILPAAKYDGVLGMWYGKGPGVDRSGDIFKHANLAGVGKNGGVLALAGDDPSCKSSTIPSQSEPRVSGPVPWERAGGSRPRTARLRALALLGAVGGREMHHRRVRRGRHC